MTGSIKCAAKRFVYVWEGPVRIVHWVNFFAIIVLSFTGYYIHNPFIKAPDSSQTYVMGTIRYLHYLVGVIFAFNILLRLYWFLVGNEFANLKSIPIPFRKRDRKNFIAYLKYYLFLEKNPPHLLGHNPVAYTVYLIMFVLFAFQAITGFALWAQADPNSTLYALTGWVFGIASNQWIRFFHYLMIYIIGAFFISHIYAATIFDFKTQVGDISSIFTGWKADRVEE